MFLMTDLQVTAPCLNASAIATICLAWLCGTDEYLNIQVGGKMKILKLD